MLWPFYPQVGSWDSVMATAELPGERTDREDTGHQRVWIQQTRYGPGAVHSSKGNFLGPRWQLRCAFLWQIVMVVRSQVPIFYSVAEQP